MNPSIRNLFADIPVSSGAEESLTLMQSDHVLVERIVSHGQHSPPDFWYDQPEDEWVVLLRGTAILQFADGSAVGMKPGDSLLIGRHVKHRVEEASPDAMWVAVHQR